MKQQIRIFDTCGIRGGSYVRVDGRVYRLATKAELRGFERANPVKVV
jgi:hypothetical protein